MKTWMIIGPMVRGVHEDPQEYGSTGTPIHVFTTEDIDNDCIIGMDKRFVLTAGIENPGTSFSTKDE